MKRLWLAFKSLPLSYKVLLVGVALFVLGSISGGITGAVSSYKDRRFQREVEQLTAERDGLAQRANEAEMRARAAEGEKAKLEMTVELAGKDAEAAKRKVEDAQTKFENDIRNIGVDIPDCERYNHLRASLKLPPVACPQSERDR